MPPQAARFPCYVPTPGLPLIDTNLSIYQITPPGPFFLSSIDNGLGSLTKSPKLMCQGSKGTYLKFSRPLLGNNGLIDTNGESFRPYC